MTCEKARKSIPLIAGGELPEWKARRLRKHLEVCDACQKELKEFKAVLTTLKSWVCEGELDWEEEDWRRLMQRVTVDKPRPGGLLLGLFIRKSWAYGFLVFLFMGLAAVSLRTIFSHRKNIEASENIIFTQVRASRALKPGDLAPSRLENTPFITKAPKQEHPRAETVAQTVLSGEIPAQERLTVTLISKQSGLRVHWTFDKNFEWKETGK